MQGLMDSYSDRFCKHKHVNFLNLTLHASPNPVGRVKLSMLWVFSIAILTTNLWLHITTEAIMIFW